MFLLLWRAFVFGAGARAAVGGVRELLISLEAGADVAEELVPNLTVIAEESAGCVIATAELYGR